jgi:XTP/dITP diphosphohydrolase
MAFQIVLATHSAHKVGEFQAILGEHLSDIEIVAYDGPEPIEDGLSFAANALIKARTAAAATGLPALADDSGICVDVLGGSPGIFSARWAGPEKDGAANLDLLLNQISDISAPHRSAQFRCSMAIVVPETATLPAFEHVAEGTWPGTIARERRGENGFGYDPIFLPDGHSGLSAAELSAEQKNAASHRGLAFAAIVPVLRMSVIPN